MINVFYDCYQILCKVYGEGSFVKQAINGTVIEEKNRDKTVKIVYGVLDKDITLSYYLKRLCDKNPKAPIRIILKIAFYNIKYLNKPPYAVTDSAVELVKKLGKQGASGFVNAMIRKFISTEIPLPQDETTRLSVEYSYPEFAVKKLVSAYGMDRAVTMMKADVERTCVRFNVGVDGKEYLKSVNFSYEETPFENVYFVKGFKMNDDFQKGVYTFQSIGSVAICNVVDGGRSLLDACSAPGGKSVYLADKFDSVTSFELHSHRVQLITDYKTRMDKNNIRELQKDASIFDEEYFEKFDAVLIDAPCSGFGVVKDNPDIKLRRTEENVEEIKKTQAEILSVCSKYVKKGGSLYYSTCSVFLDEDDLQVENFLRENNGFSVVDINSPLAGIKLKNGILFTPDLSYGAGFYVSKMIKR